MDMHAMQGGSREVRVLRARLTRLPGWCASRGARLADEVGSSAIKYLNAAPLLACLVLLAGCAAHYVAPTPAAGRTADVEFVFLGSSPISSVSVMIGDCGAEKTLGLLRSGMLLRGDNEVIRTVVDTSRPVAYRLELLGPVTGPFCREHLSLHLEPDRSYRLEVGRRENRICGADVFERIDGEWKSPRERIVFGCDF